MTLYLEKLELQQTLSQDEMISAMEIIMDGRAHDDDLKRFLTLLAARGETIDEITGAAHVLRNKAHIINAPDDALDCCGTGGDQHGTYNISTAVAIVTAACGVPMAKHGNRASSSKSGAADVLEALGVNLDAPQSTLEQTLKELNFAFMMAPNHHSAMRHVKNIRKMLAKRTIFNVLGPLINPAQTQLQLIGVYDQALVVPIAHVLKNLGTRRAWVVHGGDGLDEITTTTHTHVAILHDDGEITERTLSCEDFGLPPAMMGELIGGDAAHNARALLDVLDGKPSAYRNIVLANCAGVLCIHSGQKDLKAAAARAATAIDSGAAKTLLTQYIEITQKAIP